MSIGLIATLTFAFVSLQGAKESHSLLPQVKVGDRFVYQYRATTATGGSEGEYRARFEMSVASLEPKGTISFRTTQKDGEYVMGGQARKIPEATTNSKLKLNGELISTDVPFASPAQARFSRMMWIVVPEKPASVGTTWEWESAPDEVNGKIGLKGAGKCLAFETKNGIACAKLRLEAKETSGDTPAVANTDVWVSLADGLPVETEMDYRNVPLGPSTIGTVKGMNRRIP